MGQEQITPRSYPLTIDWDGLREAFTEEKFRTMEKSVLESMVSGIEDERGIRRYRGRIDVQGEE